MVQQVTIMTPPPPPPPPPPQPEEMKEPEIKEEPIKDETEAPPNDEQQEDAPSNEASADAQSGNDVFGQQKNTGRGWGTGRGGGYEQLVRAEINEFITDNDRLKRLDYIAEVTLRIAQSGEFEQFDVKIVSGDQEAGDLIRTVLKNKRKLAKPRPLEAPSVVKLRVKSVL
jgi:protein TonB